VILDQYGDPLVTYERRALGFTDRTLPETDSEEIIEGLGIQGSRPDWLTGDLSSDPQARRKR
jgi:hypothetical protein